MQIFREGLLMAFLTGAAICDLRDRRIPNGWIVMGLTCGSVVRILEEGEAAIRHFIPEILIPVLALFLIWKIGAIGAGDIKLVCVISIFEGLNRTFEITYLGLVISAVYGSAKLLRSRQLWKRISRFFLHLTNVSVHQRILFYTAEKESLLPLSIFIFLAAVCEKIVRML